jgi:hypothetical protein
LEGQLNQPLCFGPGDEHVGGNDELQAKKFFVTGEISNWLSPGAAGNQGLVGAQLIGGKDLLGMSVEPGPISIQSMGQQHFGVQARSITAGSSQGVGGLFQGLKG